MKHLIKTWLEKHSEQTADYLEGLQLLTDVYTRHKWKAKAKRIQKTLKVESVKNYLTLQYFLNKHEDDFIDDVDIVDSVGAKRGERSVKATSKRIKVKAHSPKPEIQEATGAALSVEDLVKELKSRRSDFQNRRVALFNRLSLECFSLEKEERLKLRTDILSLRDLVKNCTKELDYLWEHGELPAKEELKPIDLRKLAPEEIQDLPTLERLIRNTRSRRSHSKASGNLEKVRMLNDLLKKYIQQRDLLST